jgi:uncharacterized protein YjbI with pentapeptide repeats
MPGRGNQTLGGNHVLVPKSHQSWTRQRPVPTKQRPVPTNRSTSLSLRDSDMFGTRLNGAILTYADFRQVEHVEIEEIKNGASLGRGILQ